MNTLTDQQLLRDYAEHRAEAAFAELVRRHVDMVYSAALRMVRDPHSAEDVTQSVFAALARSAGSLSDRPVLSGWLHRTAQNIAANIVRSDTRRRAREQEAVAMNELLRAGPDADWEHIAPHLDAALGELSEPDRDAVLMRYVERKSAREMALTLGTSEDAAQRRVSRAVGRLREFLARRGVAVGASALGAVLSTQALHAAPAGLAAAISTGAAVAGAAIQTTTAVATKAIVMTTLQKTLVSLIVAAGVAAPLVVHQRAQTKLHERDEALQRQVERTAELEAENAKLHEGSSVQSVTAAVSNDSSSEVLKLRAEVARLRSENEGMVAHKEVLERKLPANRGKLLREKLDEMAQYKIPELQLLSEAAWTTFGTRFGSVEPPETDEEFRRVFGTLREQAKQQLSHLMGEALHRYAEAHDDQLPTDLSQLKPYFSREVDDAMLQRYELKQTGKLSDVPVVGDYSNGRAGNNSAIPRTEPIAMEKASVDDKFDTLIAIEAYGYSTRSVGMAGSGWGTFARRDANGKIEMVPSNGSSRGFSGGNSSFRSSGSGGGTIGAVPAAGN